MTYAVQAPYWIQTQYSAGSKTSMLLLSIYRVDQLILKLRVSFSWGWNRKGISKYLSYMLNGKRPRRKNLYQRYMGVVNRNDFAVNTFSQDVATEGSGTDWVRTSDLALMKRPL